MIPFVDLKQQYTANQAAYEQAMREVCMDASYILGPQVARFEQHFAEFLGVAHAIGVASGSDALRMSCQVLGLGPGDEVLIPVNTFIATASAVHEASATPVPVDIDAVTFHMDLNAAEQRVTENTKAIIPVHLYGQAVDMSAVKAFAVRHRLLIIEDACQAHGAKWENARAGAFGAAGCFSFYPVKNLGGFGDGGMIVTNQEAHAHRLRLMRNYGSVEKYVHEVSGTNSRLDSIQAAVLDVKLNSLDAWNQKRFQAACRYSELLAEVDEVTPPAFDAHRAARHVFHLYVIQCERRKELVAWLTEQGTQTGIHYPVPIHLHPAYRHLGSGPGSYPVAESQAKRILSLPMFPEITEEQIETVVRAIKGFYARRTA